MTAPPDARNLIGSRIGAYEITATIGAGGMGEVYRARDTRLDRQVAIKILLKGFAHDPDRLARFEREAKLLASLNHPHIAQVYGLEDSGAIRALVMELVEGHTLADRIAQEPIPLHEVVSIARQTAEALEYAHEHGIIHRDLKPANIKLRPDGTVKVLDFGLAKLTEPVSAASQTAAVTSPVMTQAGFALGTPAYMSPEQARGQAVDPRVDLWAFGCVCYEMLARRRAFNGETASDAISAVLTRDPDWSALPAETPAPLRRLLRRCLARELNQRLRHAGDARLELDELATGPASDVAAVPARSRARANRHLPWAIAAASLLAAVSVGWRSWGMADAVAGAGRATRVELALATGLELYPSTSSTVLASPDGQSVAFIGTSGGDRQLYLRRLDTFDATEVPGTIGATTGAFSPDSRSLAFVTAGGELKTVSLADGLVTTLARDASLLYGVTWAASGLIVYTHAGSLWSVAAAGGSPTQVTTLDGAEQLHAWPSALPDGQAVLFTVDSAAGLRVEAVTLADGARRVVMDQAARGKIGPEDRLFFYRNDHMLTAAFDASALSVIGTPTPVADIVAELGSGTAVGDVSPAGLMAFPAEPLRRHLVWVSRSGVEEPVTDVPAAYMNPRLASDGTRIVVQAGGIIVIDLQRHAVERVLTQSAAANAFPIWLSDGAIMYRSGVGIRLQNTGGGGPGRTLSGTSEFDYPVSVTADGRTLVFQRSSPETSFDILTAPLDNASTVTPLVQTPAYEAGARLSPDGRWLVYVSNESGRNEVYIRPFGGTDRRWQVSTDGGSQPVWNPNGREIFYRIGERMMAVDLTPAGSDLRLSVPRQLFARPYAYGAGITIANYDISQDGQRFIMVRDDAALNRLRVVLNWTAPTGPDR